MGHMLNFLNLLNKRRRSEDDNDNINPTASKKSKIEDLSIAQEHYFDFETLPDEIKLNILKFMDLESLNNLSRTNHANHNMITQGEINHSAVTYDIPIFGEPLIWPQIKEKYIAPSLFNDKSQNQWDEVKRAIERKTLTPLDIHLNQPAKNYKEFYELEEILNITNINIIKKAIQNFLKYNEEHGSLNLTFCSLTRFPLKQLLIDPEFGEKFLKLKALNISSNFLCDSIPNEIGQLINLEHLDFSYNLLTGSIPPEVGQLRNLKKLELSINQLTGFIPPEIGQLIKLEHLYLEQNQLTGLIPPEIGQLIKLEHLDFSYNRLTGSIPSEIGQLINLEHLNFGYNCLTGSIPPEVGQLRNLKKLELSINQLTGTVPAELGQLSNLKYIFLHNNSLSGPIPVELAQRFRILNDSNGNIAHQRVQESQGIESSIRARQSF